MNSFSPERLTPLQYSILKFHRNTPFNFAGSVIDPRHWHTTFSMQQDEKPLHSSAISDLQQLIHENLLQPEQIKRSAEDIHIVESTAALVSYLSRYALENRKKFIIEQPCSQHLNSLYKSVSTNTALTDYTSNGLHYSTLSQLLDQTNALLFLMPDNHNPTGLSISRNRRIILAELLRRSGAVLFENLSMRSFLFDGPQPPTFSSLLPEQTVSFGSLDNLYSSGRPLFWFSIPEQLKGLFPDLPEKTPEKQEVLYACEFISAFYQGRTKLLAENKLRLEAMEDAISRFLPDAEWRSPVGGQYLWVDLHNTIDTGELLAEVLPFGVSFVPGNIFYSKPASHSKIRLSFTYSNPDEIRRGVKIIRSTSEKMLLQQKP